MASVSSLSIGSNSYPVYATVAVADAYLGADPVLGPVWEALTTDAKGRYIVLATRRMDVVNWRGDKTESDQVTQWPRTGVTGVEDDELPLALQQACCQLAGEAANGVDLANYTSSAGKEKSIKAGSVSVENFRDFSAAPLPLPPAAWRLMTPYVNGGSAVGGFVSYGTDGVSATTYPYDHSTGI